MMLTRRTFGVLIASGGLAGCVGAGAPRPGLESAGATGRRDYYANLYAAIPDEQFAIPAADLSQIAPRFYRTVVDYDSGQQPGTIIVDVDAFFLYLTKEGGKALRYGVGLGREGFSWSGSADMAMKRRWPTWTPPEEMIEREPDLAQYRDGMSPGLDNPLGARALYLFQNGRDTLYRIHGTNQDWSIGKAVSSGCVRLLNHDVIDLYSRVPIGTRVVVKSSGRTVVG